MSVLEFIAAIKWPITILLLAGMALAVLRWSARTRHALGGWLQHRNLRLQVAGQQVEATLAETQGGMGLAADNDSALVRSVAEPSTDSEPAPAEYSPENVELLRRLIVEDVVKSAVRLGWQWAQRHATNPEVRVWWTEDGNPHLSLRGPAGSPDANDSLMLLRRPTESPAESALDRLLRTVRRQADETVAQQDAMREAVRRRLRRMNEEDHREPGEARDD